MNHKTKFSKWAIILSAALVIILVCLGIFLISRNSTDSQKEYYIADVDRTYQYEKILTGTFPNSSVESTWYVYTNDPDLTFEEFMLMLISSDPDDSKDFSIDDYYIADGTIPHED